MKRLAMMYLVAFMAACESGPIDPPVDNPLVGTWSYSAPRFEGGALSGFCRLATGTLTIHDRPTTGGELRATLECTSGGIVETAPFGPFAVTSAALLEGHVTIRIADLMVHEGQLVGSTLSGTFELNDAGTLYTGVFVASKQ